MTKIVGIHKEIYRINTLSQNRFLYGKKAVETNARFATSESNSSINFTDFKSKEDEEIKKISRKKYNNSKNLPNGKQLHEYLEKKFKNIKYNEI